jgi:glycogen operon protein
MGRTQGGNNNAYCQDSDVSWTDWENVRTEDQQLRAFVGELIRLRRRHRVFSRTRFFRGEVVSADGLKDITWVTPDGREMDDEDWQNGFAQCLGYVLNGAAGEFFTTGGQRDIDESFLVMLNAYHEGVEFTFPDLPVMMEWQALLDTDRPTGLAGDERRYRNGDRVALSGRSMALFINRSVREPTASVTGMLRPVPVSITPVAVPRDLGDPSEPAPSLGDAPAPTEASKDGEPPDSSGGCD